MGGELSRHQLNFELAPYRLGIPTQLGDGRGMPFAATPSLDPGNGASQADFAVDYIRGGTE